MRGNAEGGKSSGHGGGLSGSGLHGEGACAGGFIGDSDSRGERAEGGMVRVVHARVRIERVNLIGK